MTTTSEPIAIPRRDLPDAAGTFGRPRRDRERRRALVVLAAVIVPVAAVTSLGAAVIKSYWAHVEDAGRPAAASSARPDTPAVDPHRPIGPDVGTGGLSPAMTRAVERARAAAARQGITLNVVSGYRDAATQQRLFDQAVAKYGSPQAASRWVLPPDRSQHVRGGAVDVGPAAAATWLETNGVKFGLCRRYINESWPFELLAAAKGATCPAMERDASG